MTTVRDLKPVATIIYTILPLFTEDEKINGVCGETSTLTG